MALSGKAQAHICNLPSQGLEPTQGIIDVVTGACVIRHGSSLCQELQVVSQSRNVWCRVKAGEWLGPWVLCHTLEAVMKKMEPASLNVHVHVVSQPGGAVPVLYTTRSALASAQSNVSGGM